MQAEQEGSLRRLGKETAVVFEGDDDVLHCEIIDWRDVDRKCWGRRHGG